MKAKMFEVRDNLTFLVVMAVQMEPTCEADRYLMGRAGYGQHPERQAMHVCLWRVEGERHQASCDPHAWNDRTLSTAHRFIVENWDRLESGTVVDIRVVLGEATEAVLSERESSVFGTEGDLHG